MASLCILKETYHSLCCKCNHFHDKKINNAIQRIICFREINL